MVLIEFPCSRSAVSTMQVRTLRAPPPRSGLSCNRSICVNSAHCILALLEQHLLYVCDSCSCRGGGGWSDGTPPPHQGPPQRDVHPNQCCVRHLKSVRTEVLQDSSQTRMWRPEPPNCTLEPPPPLTHKLVSRFPQRLTLSNSPSFFSAV